MNNDRIYDCGCGIKHTLAEPYLVYCAIHAAAFPLWDAAKRASVTLGSAEHSLQVIADTGEKESGHTHACRARANMARETKVEIDTILTRLQKWEPEGGGAMSKPLKLHQKAMQIIPEWMGRWGLKLPTSDYRTRVHGAGNAAALRDLDYRLKAVFAEEEKVQDECS